MSDSLINVLICDDQEIVRKGLHIILSHSDGINVVGMAVDGEDALQKVPRLQPDVVLMDLKMPKLNGIQATRSLTQTYPKIKVLVLTTYDGDEWVFEAIRAGASGYLLKDTDGVDIVQAISETYEGKVRIDPQIAGKILHEFNQLQIKNKLSQPNRLLLESLTERELTILNLMAQGQTNQEIAEALFLAIGTIKNNVSHILGKLHVNDRTQAVVKALKQGIVHLDD